MIAIVGSLIEGTATIPQLTFGKAADNAFVKVTGSDITSVNDEESCL